MINFDNIAYLQQGNHRQQRAYAVLTANQILAKLQRFDPLLVGTIPINIDIESSDLDIICCFADQHDFIKTLQDNFGQVKSFAVREYQHSDTPAVVANFIADDFEVEIFGQAIPVRHQPGYRHMIIEHELLQQHGEALRHRVIELKQQGHKTEPAFAIALNLEGDPYTELLKFEATEKRSDR